MMCKAKCHTHFGTPYKCENEAEVELTTVTDLKNGKKKTIKRTLCSIHAKRVRRRFNDQISAGKQTEILIKPLKR